MNDLRFSAMVKGTSEKHFGAHCKTPKNNILAFPLFCSMPSLRIHVQTMGALNILGILNLESRTFSFHENDVTQNIML